MSISKRLRFEVFKRDSFKCQYCGKCAPDVVLHADHIKPASQGGTTDLLNLITACIDCNLGKGAIPLSDVTAVSKQRSQLEQLQERREQLEMLMKWQESLSDLREDVVDRVSEFWKSQVTPFSLNQHGLSSLRKLLAKYSPAEVMSAISTATTHYIERGKDGRPTDESVQLAWDKVNGVCSVNKATEDEPELPDLLYIRGIVRNRCSYYYDHALCLNWLRAALSWGVPIRLLKQEAKYVRNWTSFSEMIDELIEEAKREANR